MTFHTKFLWVQFRFDKVDGFIKMMMMELDIWYHLVMNNMMQFVIGLDIL